MISNELRIALSNDILNATPLSWFVAQILKVIIVFVTTKKFNKERFIGSGGMPSSHSSGMATMSVMVLRTCGFPSSQFAISIILTLVVMYDAMGVRRATGEHATIINKLLPILDDDKDIFGEENLKELIGHTPLQVIMGAFLGVFIGCMYRF